MVCSGWQFSNQVATKFRRPVVAMTVNPFSSFLQQYKRSITACIVASSLNFWTSLPSLAEEGQPMTEVTTTTTTTDTDAAKVPLYTTITSDVQQYVDIGRGFKLLRPFGFNQFDGAGTAGYIVKFASLFDSKNVISS
jgi:hypothetical protein